MKDLQFQGSVGGQAIDITFRTDMISQEDEFFNVTQIQVGPDFELNEESSDHHADLFNEFKRINHSLSAFKDHAEDKGLELTIQDADGDNRQVLVEEASVSESV
jgi:hypothetical protein